MKFARHLSDVFNKKKLLRENPIFVIIFFTPAAILSSILTIPLMLICIPISILSNSAQKKIMKVLLYAQHSISLSALYILEEIVFKNFNYYDILLGGGVALLTFRLSIKQMVNETLVKTFS